MNCYCPNLKTVPLFSNLTQSQLDGIGDICHMMEVPDQTTLFSPGDLGGRLFLTLRGGVKLTTPISKKERAALLITEGESFGEVNLLSKSPQTSHAVTIATENQFIVLHSQDFRELLSRDFDLAERLFSVLAKRLESPTLNRLEPISHSSLARVARLLLARSNPTTGMLLPPASQEEIARTIGVRRETVARNLARLEATACLNRNRGQLIVLDRERLERVARSA